MTATNAGGSTAATSSQTAVVQIPPPLPPLGKTAVGALTHPFGGDYLEVSGGYTLASPQSVTKLSAYLQGGGSATAMRAVIYADSGNQPGALVGVSGPVTIAAGQAAGWVDFPISGSPTVPAGQYWLGLWAANTSAVGYYDNVSGSGYYAPTTYSAAGDPPANWPGGGSFDSLSYSLYATLGTPSNAPASTVLPAISGTAQQGQTLTADNGTWSNSPTGFAYQWQRCDTGGANCADIGGATNSTYTLVAGDVGKTIRVVVTATNAFGSTSATSSQTAVVQAAPPTGPTLGKTAVGASAHPFGGDYLEVSGRYTLASASPVTKLTAYLQGGGSATAMRAVIYADSGNQPGAFVAVSGPVTINAGQAAGWVDFPLSGSPALPAGQYWLGLWASNASTFGFYDDVSGSGYFAPATYSAGSNPPAGWPGGVSDTLSYSLYATLGALTERTGEHGRCRRSPAPRQQGQTLTRRQRQLGQQSDRLRVSVAPVRFRRVELHQHRRRDQLHVHAGCRRRGLDAAGGRDGDERGRIDAGDLGSDRGRAGGAEPGMERRLRDEHGRVAGGRDGDDCTGRLHEQVRRGVARRRSRRSRQQGYGVLPHRSRNRHIHGERLGEGNGNAPS